MNGLGSRMGFANWEWVFFVLWGVAKGGLIVDAWGREGVVCSVAEEFCIIIIIIQQVYALLGE